MSTLLFELLCKNCKSLIYKSKQLFICFISITVFKNIKICNIISDNKYATSENIGFLFLFALHRMPIIRRSEVKGNLLRTCMLQATRKKHFCLFFSKLPNMFISSFCSIKRQLPNWQNSFFYDVCSMTQYLVHCWGDQSLQSQSLELISSSPRGDVLKITQRHVQFILLY